LNTKTLKENYELIQKLITKYEFVSDRYQSLSKEENQPNFVIRCKVPDEIMHCIKNVQIEHENTIHDMFLTNGPKY